MQTNEKNNIQLHKGVLSSGTGNSEFLTITKKGVIYISKRVAKKK